MQLQGCSFADLKVTSSRGGNINFVDLLMVEVTFQLSEFQLIGSHAKGYCMVYTFGPSTHEVGIVSSS